MSKIGIVIPSWNVDSATAVAQNLQKFDRRKYITQVVISGASRTEHRWGPVEAMAKGAQKLAGADIYVFCHDDIEVYEDWTDQVAGIFEMCPEAGLVGFHGAKGLGSSNIYRAKYELNQLARFMPISNMVDAETHGKRVTLPTEVATIDGFFMAITTDAYRDIGGWEACLEDNIVFHMYDSWMAMALRERGYSTYLTPVRCTHKGGKTEVGMAKEYEAWALENGFKDSGAVHTDGHKAFYERFRGQLPVRVK